MNCIEAAARYLATEPAAVERALAAHRPDGTGRCTCCRGTSQWPCAIAASAHLARTLLDEIDPPLGSRTSYA